MTASSIAAKKNIAINIKHALNTSLLLLIISVLLSIASLLILVSLFGFISLLSAGLPSKFSVIFSINIYISLKFKLIIFKNQKPKK
jgi:hypothetical protein